MFIITYYEYFSHYIQDLIVCSTLFNLYEHNLICKFIMICLIPVAAEKYYNLQVLVFYIYNNVLCFDFHIDNITNSRFYIILSNTFCDVLHSFFICSSIHYRIHISTTPPPLSVPQYITAEDILMDSQSNSFHFICTFSWYITRYLFIYFFSIVA